MKHRQSGSAFSASLGKVPLVWWLTLGAAAPLDACSSTPRGNQSEQVGSLGVNLEVAPGVTLSSVTYTITGNGFSKSDGIDVSGAPIISGTIGGIPAGDGYTITLTAASADGGTTFTGASMFDVTAGGTAAVTVHLRGTSRTGKGSVAVNGTLNVAPVIDDVAVTPLTVFVGSSVALAAVGSDADNGPSPLSYYWATTGGAIDDPIAPHTTMTSATPGTFTVTLTLADGDTTDSVTQIVKFVDPGNDGSGSAGSGSGAEPNVLLIIADDLGAESTSLYPSLIGDSGAVPIPNIEALAQKGLVFDNAWASPVCSPTRSTIVTGLYGYRTGVTTVGDVVPTSTVTLFDRITAESPAVYAQAFFGKYHLGFGGIDPRPGDPYPQVPDILQHVRDLGITTYRGILGGGVTDYFDWTAYDINGPEVPTTTFATTALTDFAIDHIRQHQATKPGEPWFIYQAFNAPHAANGGSRPYQVPPANLHHVDLSSVGNPAPGAVATNIPIYQAQIQSLDTELGRLFAEIDLEKTTVIFIGDNGTPGAVKDTGTGLRDSKGTVYEGGVRIPMIVAGAGVTRRGREDQLFVTTDFYATILELTGVSASHVNDSYSLKPLFSDPAASSGRTHSFTEISTGTSGRSYAVKDNRYKLINNLGTWELYDLVADPLEATDLYTSAPHAAVLATLKAEIATLATDAPPGYFQ